MIRPDLIAALRRAQGVIWALGIAAAGAWLAWLGGYLLVPLGLAVICLGAALGVMAWRRMRFAQDTLAPGLVEVDEGQIGYLGPTIGGYVSLPELAELRLITMRGRRLWRLKQTDGQTILIPIDAAGADQLFDVFASLPGMDTGALVAALGQTMAGQTMAGRTAAGPSGQTLPVLAAQGPEMQMIWRRRGAAEVARS